MKEYIIDTLAEAEAAARAIEKFLLDAADPHVWDELPLDYLPAAEVMAATQFASSLVACLIHLHQSDEQHKAATAAADDEAAMVAAEDDDAQTP